MIFSRSPRQKLLKIVAHLETNVDEAFRRLDKADRTRDPRVVMPALMMTWSTINLLDDVFAAFEMGATRPEDPWFWPLNNDAVIRARIGRIAQGREELRRRASLKLWPEFDPYSTKQPIRLSKAIATDPSTHRAESQGPTGTPRALTANLSELPASERLGRIRAAVHDRIIAELGVRGNEMNQKAIIQRAEEVLDLYLGVRRIELDAQSREQVMQALLADILAEIPGHGSVDATSTPTPTAPASPGLSATPAPTDMELPPRTVPNNTRLLQWSAMPLMLYSDSREATLQALSANIMILAEQSIELLERLAPDWDYRSLTSINLTLEVEFLFLYLVDVHALKSMGSKWRDRLMGFLAPTAISSTLDSAVKEPENPTRAAQEAFQKWKTDALVEYRGRVHDFMGFSSFFPAPNQDPSGTLFWEFARSLIEQVGAPSQPSTTMHLLECLLSGYSRLRVQEAVDHLK